MATDKQIVKKGDHIFSPRGFFYHHGIYVGGGQVIHYSGLSSGFKKGKVCLTTIQEFSGDHQIIAIYTHEEPVYSPEEVIKRAISRLNEDAYNIFKNNCEHFATWCITGKNHSEQIQKILNLTARIDLLSPHQFFIATLPTTLSMTKKINDTTAVGSLFQKVSNYLYEK
uniref:NC domain protein n=1 Tax=Pectobacterium carotovorum TaxID=554 RepID=A0A0K0MPN6_PECCA|nr:lecithin retinol acyltransferase family protein [Pectobacterium carotovorum]AKG47558.1 NC domain protein [Pectobacterium carotovorum]